MSTTYGAKMYGSSGPYADYYVFVSNKGAMLSGGSGYLYAINGGLHASDEITVDSDIRLKSDIRTDIDKYEQFFFGLKPSTFCLKSHNDNMRHIGLSHRMLWR